MHPPEQRPSPSQLKHELKAARGDSGRGFSRGSGGDAADAAEPSAETGGWRSEEQAELAEARALHLLRQKVEAEAAREAAEAAREAAEAAREAAEAARDEAERSQEAAEEAREAAEEVATAKALQVAVLEQALSAAVDDAEMERQSSVCGCWPRPAGIGARYGARLHGWAGVALGTALYRAGLRQDLPPSEFLPAALFEAEPVCTRAPPPSLAGGAPSAPFQLRAATRQTMGKGPS